MHRAWPVVMALVLLGTPAADGAIDRLSRVDELRPILSGTGDAPPADVDAAVAELFALADEEIVENLATGGPFASPDFIQERLEAFMLAWGGASFRVHRLASGRAPTSLTVGVFAVPGPAPSGSVRVYGRRRDGTIARLAVIAHDGMPELHRWPAARDGAPQFVATWFGAASGRGGRPLAVEVWRGGGDGVERLWTSSTLFPDGLSATAFAVKNGTIAIRYEPEYPGWKPGCDRQTEHVDFYRPDARRPGLVLSRRDVLNGWHRDLQRAVGRLLDALSSGDARAVRALVPDRALATRLPRALAREPACDEAGPDSPTTATVAVTEEAKDAVVPWSLTWRRMRGGWRLVALTRMLQ